MRLNLTQLLLSHWWDFILLISGNTVTSISKVIPGGKDRKSQTFRNGDVSSFYQNEKKEESSLTTIDFDICQGVYWTSVSVSFCLCFL